MKSSTQFRIGLSVLALLHLAVLIPGFFAPYDPAEQDRSLSFAPPTAIHFKAHDGSWRLRPFIYSITATDDGNYAEQSGPEYPLRFFVRAAPYRLFGIIPSATHLVGVDAQAKFLLIGADLYGRDQFSRLLYGGQISLFAGLLAAALSLSTGLVLGTLAGYYGKWLDDLLMRISEAFLAIPWLYLLLGIRAFLPLSLDARSVFLLL